MNKLTKNTSNNNQKEKKLIMNMDKNDNVTLKLPNAYGIISTAAEYARLLLLCNAFRAFTP